MREAVAVNRKMRVTMVRYQQNSKRLTNELFLTLGQTKKSCFGINDTCKGCLLWYLLNVRFFVLFFVFDKEH